MASTQDCKVCGNHIPLGDSKCPLCGTEFVQKEGKTRARVSVERKAAETLDVDISDPKVRAALEELTLIPGVKRGMALVLYSQGVRSASDLIKKAMPGEVRGDSYARILANKLAIDAAKKGKKARERMIPCPSCRSPSKVTMKSCGVCGAALSVEDVDLSEVKGRLEETVREYLGEFADTEEFTALPRDMKVEIAAVLSSKQEMSEAEVKRVASTLTSLPQEMAEMFDEMAMEEEPGEGATGDRRKLKKREILRARLDKWRKMGYDVAELESLVDGDFDTFKNRAKEILSSKLKKAGAKPKEVEERAPPAAEELAAKPSKPKPQEGEAPPPRPATAAEREKFSKQIESWRSKGFDVEGLRELLESDMEEFKRRSMAMLKRQMSKAK